MNTLKRCASIFMCLLYEIRLSVIKSSVQLIMTTRQLHMLMTGIKSREPNSFFLYFFNYLFVYMFYLNHFYTKLY